MLRTVVISRNIRSVGYDAGTKTLEIEFHSGGVYQYSGVPEKRYNAMMRSPAISAYFIRDIKPWYSYKKVG